MDHDLHTRLELPLPIDEVFAFFAEAQNLERITPPELRFEILTEMPISMGRGTLLAYRLGLFGVPFRWRTRIAAWDPPHGFIDLQLSGPYALWEHTHVFAATGSGTLIDDHVRYRLPLSPLGDVAYPLVKRQLARIFAYRRQAVREALLGPATRPHVAASPSRQ
jgi:ligand-binding SRPBCC domain-containing protein